MAVVLLAALSAGRAACLRFWPLALPRAAAAGTALPGLRVGGVPLTGARVEPQIAAWAQAIEDRHVKLVVLEGGAARVIRETTLGALGVSVDVQGVASLALRVGRVGDLLTRARLAERARRGALDLPLDVTLDANVALAAILPLEEDLDVVPVAARLDVERHLIVPEMDGRALDVDGAMAAVRHAALEPNADLVALPIVVVRPRITRASLASVDVSHVLATFSTYFSRRGEQASRAQNVEVAAAHVDGLIIEPGQLVSFNDTVGARSEDNGFRKAYEIFKGEMVEGTGGGTCQVASTLHAIAFFGGLDIVQRLPHSRPSAYIPVGLDATVAYPVVDLKLRNPFDFPVVVHAVVDANKLTMQLLGADKPVRVALMRSVVATTRFDRKVVEDATIDKPKRKQKGADGIKLLRKRVITLRSGQNKFETSRDTYPPTTEVWKVPPGYDESNLPPLGEDFPNPDAPDSSAPTPPPAPPAGDPEQTIWGG